MDKSDAISVLSECSSRIDSLLENLSTASVDGTPPRRCGAPAPEAPKDEYMKFEAIGADNPCPTPNSYGIKYRGQPGFLDPLHVVEVCISKLKSAVYQNVNYASRSLTSRHRPVDKSVLSPGLLLYKDSIGQPSEQVQNDLQNFIHHGGRVGLLLKDYSLQDVMHFLLEYLRRRGALLRFQVNCSTDANGRLVYSLPATRRHVFMQVQQNLKFFELEFQAAVTLGDYLDFTLSVAHAHDAAWIKQQLISSWAEVMVNLVPIYTESDQSGDIMSPRSGAVSRPQIAPLTDADPSSMPWSADETQSIQRGLLSSLLHNVPWGQLHSMENVQVTMCPDLHTKR